MTSIDEFRQAFPEFADASVFQDSRIRFWMELAQDMLIKKKWGNVYDKGVYLYVAHCLTVEKCVMESKEGSIGGGSVGAVSSESQNIGDTSYSTSYDTQAYAGDGQMAATVYGQMFLDLRRLIGVGAWQL